MVDTLALRDHFALPADRSREVDPLTVRVAIKVTEQGAVLPLDPECVTVMSSAGPLVANGALPPIAALLRGDRACPEILGEPPRDLLPIFHCIEGTAADWCRFTGTRVRDEQFEELYTLLRRRPDGRGGPLFTYVRAAAQVALLLRPTSAAEFDQVVRRLTRSARTFRTASHTTNYLEQVLLPLTELGGH